MNFKSSFWYALKIFFSRDKYSPSRGRKSLIGALVCIAVSIIPLVAVLSVSKSMVNGMTERLIGLSTQDIQAVFDYRIPECRSTDAFMALKKRIEGYPEVSYVVPEIQGTGLVVSKTKRSGVCIRGIEEDLFRKNSDYKNFFNVESGSAEFTSEKQAIIGSKLAQDLGLSVGDRVTLVTLKDSSDGGFMPKTTAFKVVAVISSGYQEMDALWFFIPMQTAFDVLSKKNSLFVQGLKTPDTFTTKLPVTVSTVTRYLWGEDGRSAVDGFKMSTWIELNQDRLSNFSSTRLLLVLIVSFIVIIASINISSSLVMIVLERRKEIAILKSVGGSASGISFSFMIVGLLSGVAGLAAGVPLGVAVSVNSNSIFRGLDMVVNFFRKIGASISNVPFEKTSVYDPSFYIQNAKMTVDPKDLLIVCVAVILLSVIVSVVPAIKAGKQKPVQTLRKM